MQRFKYYKLPGHWSAIETAFNHGGGRGMQLIKHSKTGQPENDKIGKGLTAFCIKYMYQ